MEGGPRSEAGDGHAMAGRIVVVHQLEAVRLIGAILKDGRHRFVGGPIHRHLGLRDAGEGDEIDIRRCFVRKGERLDSMVFSDRLVSGRVRGTHTEMIDGVEIEVGKRHHVVRHEITHRHGRAIRNAGAIIHS